MGAVDFTPERVRSDHAAAFAADHLRGRPRVLHVARTPSGVPARLAEIGFAVSRARPDELAGMAEPFDAIVLTHTLSGVASLDATVAQASRLLAPTGRLVVDDLDVAAPDAPSLRWFYDMQELLVVAGLHAPDCVHARNSDVLERWRNGMRAAGTLHTGKDVRVAISKSFMIRELRRLEFFYRYIADGLPEDERGASVAAHLRGVERRMIAADTLMPVGLRIVADRAR